MDDATHLDGESQWQLLAGAFSDAVGLITATLTPGSLADTQHPLFLMSQQVMAAGVNPSLLICALAQLGATLVNEVAARLEVEPGVVCADLGRLVLTMRPTSIVVYDLESGVATCSPLDGEVAD